MASDGSVQAPNGSFAWVLYGTQSQIHLTGHNTLTGGHSDLSTFQAEACGYLGALYALKAILTNSTHITSNLYIDNLGVISAPRIPPSPSSNASSPIGTSCTKHTKSEQLSLPPSQSYMCKATRMRHPWTPIFSPCQPTSTFLQIPGPTRHIRVALTLTKHHYYPPHK